MVYYSAGGGGTRDFLNIIKFNTGILSWNSKLLPCWPVYLHEVSASKTFPYERKKKQKQTHTQNKAKIFKVVSMAQSGLDVPPVISLKNKMQLKKTQK